MSSTIKYFLFLTLLSTTSSLVFAQEHFTVSGYVSDSSSSERLMNANIRRLPASHQGTFSNDFGFYSITLTAGEITLACSYIGYQTDTIHFYLNKDTTLNFHLPSVSFLKEITVSSHIPVERQSGISHISIPVKELSSVPSLMGEKDILKAIQLLPGVQTGNDGSTGLFVRGGSPDQNLILLDGVPVYNVSHLFGFVSVFTPEAIQSVDLYKGGFPAHYGGRLSSVLDIRMKEGDMKKMKGDVAVGLLSAKFSLEGPIKKNKSSFIVSARRSYLDLLAKPFIALIGKTDNGSKMFGYYFQDYTAKFNNIIDDKNRIYFSFYGGNDKLHAKFKETNEDADHTYHTTTKAGLGWGNITGAARWNREISPQLFSNLTLSYTRFQYALKAKNNQTNTDKQQALQSQYNCQSNIRDWAAKLDFDYAPSPAHAVKFGGAFIFHRFQPGVQISNNSGDSSQVGPPSKTKQGNAPIYSKKIDLYGEDNITFTDHLKANIGLRFALYNVDHHYYSSLQPRFAGRYLLGHQWALKVGYARMFQPLHLLINSGIGLPTDLWVPATSKVPPESSNQYTVGVAKTYQQQYEFTAEAYYKTMDGVIAYKNGANFSNINVNWQDKVEIGKGKAYGLELFLQKKKGKTTGWISYTVAWNHRKFPNINNGKRFPYKFDRRHDIKLVLIHHFSKYFQASASWVYASGNMVTLPTFKYNVPYNMGINTFDQSYYGVNQTTVKYIPRRNNFRMRAYHRLDLSLDFIKEKKDGIRTWNVSIYNLYSRQNPYFYYYQRGRYDQQQLKQFSLFPIIPSLTYSFQFK